MLPLCSSLRNQIEGCYNENRNTSLNCSQLVRDYAKCVTEARKVMCCNSISSSEWNNFKNVVCIIMGNLVLYNLYFLFSPCYKLPRQCPQDKCKKVICCEISGCWSWWSLMCLTEINNACYLNNIFKKDCNKVYQNHFMIRSFDWFLLWPNTRRGDHKPTGRRHL